jgi:uncharacterized protein
MEVSSLFPLGWQHYLAGGLLLGAGVALMFILTGLVTGMSTVFTSTWSYFSRGLYFQQPRFTESRGWRLVLAAGLVLGAGLWWLLLGPPCRPRFPRGTWRPEDFSSAMAPG